MAPSTYAVVARQACGGCRECKEQELLCANKLNGANKLRYGGLAVWTVWTVLAVMGSRHCIGVEWTIRLE